jgi:hypothetical protein
MREQAVNASGAIFDRCLLVVGQWNLGQRVDGADNRPD